MKELSESDEELEFQNPQDKIDMAKIKEVKNQDPQKVSKLKSSWAI